MTLTTHIIATVILLVSLCAIYHYGIRELARNKTVYRYAALAVWSFVAATYVIVAYVEALR